MNWKTVKEYACGLMENILKFNCYEDAETFKKNINGYVGIVLRTLKEAKAIADYDIAISCNQDNVSNVKISVTENEGAESTVFDFVVGHGLR